MKLNRRFIRNKEKAVSVVIGVILMVAITVAVAVTVYVYMSGMGGETPRISTLLMNTYSQNDGTDTRIWLVIGAGGDAISYTSYAWSLLGSDGKNCTRLNGYTADATCTFNEVSGYGYVNSGDTFTVNANNDGYFVFMLIDTSTGSTLYKSSSVKY